MKKKKCAHLNCEKYFEDKNQRKRFCCLSCKNKAAYLYKLQNYTWEISQFKSRRINIQILEYLYQKNRLLITLDDLKLLGFIVESAIIPNLNSLNQVVYRFGNILLTKISLTKFKMSKI